ncbi:MULTISPECIES: dihydroxyacetone kinase subunit DhaL [Paraburkholderia]|uniref:PEP-dependent dihydroxyacetone kinase 2, ADP-binding subunit DhaL n=1 Tax=Paraburkholderia aspalathi TaxID=1324617 RepID=A0ABN7MCE9_9BURK|nr:MULTISPECIES: dihydroxyacetone kinase subunit DhaL [Paraburkholderia]MBK3821067.1 dihydroxyacetone kinase subunit L [Paraburkholderia aspalathi]MBK3832856.1 dihydroxyacetone kinase subunit L [Paraburkholderia aspalathi]MBK3840562.1 dihydroxyacetone kinase subunit L [Paraburkholderia aspalathi]MBK3862624.1 dihydroxyacetone kinase subunit L [Paraburkholderia aspalathi]MCX4159191.1 dihydroxyacetone kinase subunit DhaL [Paraburkholderia aspalathi]
MTETVKLAGAGGVVVDLVRTINANRQYLSEVDGAIGDGDHGINMSKGFTQCGEHLAARGALPSLTVALGDLSSALMDGIGGSMGPLYGTFFLSMSDTFADHTELDKSLFYRALVAGIDSVQEIGDAKVGDKTLIDTLVPARVAYGAALEEGKNFRACIDAMVIAAEAGMNSTRELRARIGRAARLGDRSIGVLDAGACSCFLILRSMGESLTHLLDSATARAA